ncbi:LA2681 family HEPN domain-containing protein [Anaerocolumna sp. AGMB13020]|uniref:LA2681 family HEPN domain-containing protein n=1 Tax=Anaerocolumna sp. AGMB13020 TaxID=3081750 RepID=UPI002955893B|nr:LA2681 family HEPN domain-containing protein [Anaerocolumna sp. AGMB13020]WOO38099.1 LA2681 family HEPN domain-containing protein [Anaerocolumna sp. AGMB13020]
MLGYEKYIEEFERDFISVIDVAVIKLSKTFDKLFSEQKKELIPNTIKRALTMLKADYNIPTKMQISYDIANGYHDLRILTQEKNLEKEIYYLRNVLDMYEYHFEVGNEQNLYEPITKVARYIAMRTYTNIGNTMRITGRYIAAIDYFNDALLIEKAFAMASLNLSLTLFQYAQFQIKSYEQNYFHHACYYFYQQTQKYKVNLEEQGYLAALEKNISMFHPDYIEGYLKKPLDLPVFGIRNLEEARYREYMLAFRLFLEPCLDILGDHCFAVDSINLPLDKKDDSKNEEFIGLFNQIKQEFNLARYLWYKSTVLLEPSDHFADCELDLTDIGDYADHSLRESLLRTAFKTAYSVFDRIGFFINHYFNIGLTGTMINFKNIWKEELKDRNGNSYFLVPNPIIKKHGNNPLIKAMYWLQKDFYEDKKTNITSPNAEPMFQMRNDMEHNCLRTGKKQGGIIFTKYTSEYRIGENTCRLLKLSREMIIYLCLAINFENRENNQK